MNTKQAKGWLEMKISVIYYSHTGHTTQLADELVRQLRQAGHSVEVFLLETVGTLSMSAERVAILETPDISVYDALAIGTPVHGGRISAPVMTFIEGTSSFSYKPVGFFLTHFFPRKMSAHITIDALEKLGREKGGHVLGSESVTWFSFNRKKQIKQAAKTLANRYPI
jgi:multimeric flavodoxin WrbA